MDYGHWDLLVDDFEPEDYLGFIYLIVNNKNGRRYIGKRNFEVKGKSADSWKYYTGSQKHLNGDILNIGVSLFDFIIVSLCNTKDDLNRLEYILHIRNNVLRAKSPTNEKLFYNRNIANTLFDSSGIKRKDWIKYQPVYPIHEFINIYTHEHFTGSHISFAEMISVDSKRVLRIIDGQKISIKGWILPTTDKLTVRRRIHSIQNIITEEIFSGTVKEIIAYTGTTLYCLKDLIYGRQKSTRGWKLL